MLLKQYRFEHLVQNHIEYKQVTISKYDGVSFRGKKVGKDIGRKRQFMINLDEYPNTLMFVRQGVKDGAIGVAPTDVNGCIVTENMPMFAIQNVEVEYLELIIKSPYFTDELAKISTTGSAQKSIHERQILEIEIPFPTADEQLLFINQIRKLKSHSIEIKIELDKQLDLVKKLRQQLLQDAIQGKLLPQNPDDEPASTLLQKIKTEKAQLIRDGKLKKEKELRPTEHDEIPFELPDNWVWCRFGEILLEIKYGTSQNCDYDSSKNSPVLRIPNVSSGSITGDDLKFTDLSSKEKLDLALHENDILIIRSNGSRELVGKTVLVTSKFLNYAFAGYLVRLRFNKQLINAKYLLYATNSKFFRTLIEKPLRTTVGINNINTTEISNLLISVPPIDEQNRIVENLNKTIQSCNVLEENIKQSQQQNEQLLQQVLREALSKKVATEEQQVKDVPVIADEKYKVLLLAAEIIWQLNQKQTLGHIKLQKLIYLCERTQQMDLPVNFLKRAMGPYDRELQIYLDKELEQRQWFSYNEDELLKYRMLKNAGGHKTDFKKYFQKETEAIYKLINTFENVTSAKIEIIATLFACWEKMIKNNQIINDTALSVEFYDWSESKTKYTKAQVIEGLRWMENYGIVPKSK